MSRAASALFVVFLAGQVHSGDAILKLKDSGYFKIWGLNVLVFSKWYNDLFCKKLLANHSNAFILGGSDTNWRLLRKRVLSTDQATGKTDSFRSFRKGNYL